MRRSPEELGERSHHMRVALITSASVILAAIITGIFTFQHNSIQVVFTMPRNTAVVGTVSSTPTPTPTPTPIPTPTSTPASGSPAFRDTLPSGSSLLKNDYVLSSGGRYQLILQDDGNLVLYDLSAGQKALWSSGTAGRAVSSCIMQASDGNFVIYGYPSAIWSSQTLNHPNAYLRVQDDGNVVIYQGSVALWSTRTVQP